MISIQVLQHLKHKIYINYTHIYDLWMNPNLKFLKVEGEKFIEVQSLDLKIHVNGHNLDQLTKNHQCPRP
jgi:hypothetical protein